MKITMIYEHDDGTTVVNNKVTIDVGKTGLYLTMRSVYEFLVGVSFTKESLDEYIQIKGYNAPFQEIKKGKKLK